MTRKRVFLAMPNNNAIVNETWQAVLESGRDDLFVYTWRSENSLLAHNFNICLQKCLAMGDFDFYAQIHADIGADKGFLGTLLDQIETHGHDVIHAVVPIKNNSGLTSTAIAYSDDEWALERRITMTELSELPKTFDILNIRNEIDSNAVRLLPNTGCLMLRLGEWVDDFPGFEIKSRLTRDDESNVKAETVPEDWNFGHWCARNGVTVAGTKAVGIGHWGRWQFRNDEVWGQRVDEAWRLKAEGVAA